MLEFIREKAKGIIAWAIIILIGIPFALWGINNYFTGPKTIVVAEVNGEPITAIEFVRVYQRQKQQLQQQLGERYDQLVDDRKLRRQILDRLIEQKLIQQWAADHHMAISDAQVAMVIQSAPIFADKDGKFSKAKYEQVLRANGLTIPEFEQLQKLSLLEQQYRALTQASTLAWPAEVNQLVDLQRQQRKVGWIQLDMTPFINAAQVTDQQVQAYYDQHRDEFVEPEKVVVDYVLLDKRQLAAAIKPDEATLKQFYEDNRDLFTQPEERRARHILIPFKAGDEKSEQAALKQAQALEAKLKQGADFAELAKKYSKDPGSAAVGGDLGWFEQGTMVPEFDKKVFAMKKGEISEPVRTQFGWHIIQLEDIRPAQTQPFDKARERALALYREQQADKQYYDLLEKLNTQAYEQPDTLEPAAQAIGARVQTSKPFSRAHGEGLFANPKAREAAFGEEVYKQHLNSQVIELNPNQALVLRINRVIPQHQLPLEKVRDRIVETLKRQQAHEKAVAALMQALARLKAGKPVEQVLTPAMQWHAPVWVDRMLPKLPPEVMQAAFKAPKPRDGHPVWQLIEVNGAPALMVVEDVRLTDDNKLPKLLRDQLKAALAGILGDAEVRARIEALRQHADIEIHKDYETVK